MALVGLKYIAYYGSHSVSEVSTESVEDMESVERDTIEPLVAASSFSALKLWLERCKSWVTSRARRALWGDYVPHEVNATISSTLCASELPEALPGVDGPLPEFEAGNGKYVSFGRMRIVSQIIADVRFQFGAGRDKMTTADRLTRRHRTIRLIEEFIEERRKADNAANRSESLRRSDKQMLRMAIDFIVSASYVPSEWDIKERMLLGSQAVSDRFAEHEREYGKGGIVGRLIHPWGGPAAFRKV